MRISDKNKLLEKIKPEFRDFMEVHTRSSSTKHVVIVSGDRFDDFLATLLSSGADDESKLVLALALSGGMRIGEVLALQRRDIEKDQDQYFATCRVLKKRRFVQRQLVIHEAIVPLLTKYMMTKRGFDKLFTLDRHQALYQIKKVIGESMDLHALRHTYISYLAFTMNFSAELISTMQALEPKTVTTYLHADQKKVLRDIYSKKKSA